MKNSPLIILKSPFTLLLGVLFIVLTGWWINLNFLSANPTGNDFQLWAAVYQIIAILGGVAGVLISLRWGGFKSIIGRAILSFSLGLFLQSFGQSVYSYYIFYRHIDVPYPSIGDLGFFGTIPAYIYGVLLLARASGVRVSLRSFANKLWAVLIPLAMLTASYTAFLKGYEFDWSNPLRIFLDFGYPLGQAIYVSLAILTLLLSFKMLGGIMKGPIFFLIFALIVQYLSDYMFLYEASHQTWAAGHENDYLYLVSYLLMSFSLIYIGQSFNRIKES